MNKKLTTHGYQNEASERGSILIYVLWILVVISVLAFQLSASTRATTLGKNAQVKQLKDSMQLASAIQFARFKIRARQWENNEYDLKLNDQVIKIKIFNESGFISLYELSNRSLKNALKSINLSQEAVDKIGNYLQKDGKQIKFNDYLELKQFSPSDTGFLKPLASTVSIFFDGEVNPYYSPPEVLMQLSRVDQFRVHKLMQSDDAEERRQLRNEIIEQLSAQGMEVSDDLSVYYRVYVSFGENSYKVFLKFDRRMNRYITVLVFNDLKVT